MSKRLYADTANVAQAIEQAVETTEIGEETRVEVYDSEAVLRGETRDEIEERNLFGHLGEQVCVFTYDGTRLTVGFHQKQVEQALTLRPARHDALPPVQQATSPKELAPAVGHVLDSVERKWDIITYDLMEVSCASIANGGHFTDWEFEYAVTTTDL